jgi:tetratricopeptide (TPR) repeat protein
MDHVSELPEDVVEELEEVDFFIEQELFDEADVILAGLEEEYGAHPEVSGRVARLVGVKDGRDGAAGDPKPLSTPPPGKAGSAERLTFDADSLAEDLNLNDITHDSEVEDLEEVFNRFKVGVQEQVEKTDYSTHYDLGLAYREMGLFADAIAEFEIAVGDPERRAEIKMMIGTCQVALERFEDAVTSFMSGLVVDSISDQQKCGLMYELGKTFQMMGRREEAVDIFDEIESIEPGFADVSIRIEALRGGTVSSLKRGLFD